jgi:hypothetical protein
MTTKQICSDADQVRLRFRITEFDSTIDHWRRQLEAARHKLEQCEQAKRRFIDGLPDTLY